MEKVQDIAATGITPSIKSLGIECAHPPKVETTGHNNNNTNCTNKNKKKRRPTADGTVPSRGRGRGRGRRGWRPKTPDSRQETAPTGDAVKDGLREHRGCNDDDLTLPRLANGTVPGLCISVPVGGDTPSILPWDLTIMLHSDMPCPSAIMPAQSLSEVMATWASRNTSTICQSRELDSLIHQSRRAAASLIDAMESHNKMEIDCVPRHVGWNKPDETEGDLIKLRGRLPANYAGDAAQCRRDDAKADTDACSCFFLDGLADIRDRKRIRLYKEEQEEKEKEEEAAGHEEPKAQVEAPLDQRSILDALQIRSSARMADVALRSATEQWLTLTHMTSDYSLAAWCLVHVTSALPVSVDRPFAEPATPPPTPAKAQLEAAFSHLRYDAAVAAYLAKDDLTCAVRFLGQEEDNAMEASFRGSSAAVFAGSAGYRVSNVKVERKVDASTRRPWLMRHFDIEFRGVSTNSAIDSEARQSEQVSPAYAAYYMLKQCQRKCKARLFHDSQTTLLEIACKRGDDWVAQGSKDKWVYCTMAPLYCGAVRSVSGAKE
ncbi:hypothetical protein ml_396 [Mollivirus sibericum]|uniref:hypothetical protein n=1 Tax=Mollivirus sibericum TaxID=1678078 RepID=UPI0006B2EF72|nr:hypothetical protein ml_396 [Mollivirus sibericum]ALD62198.1 hypothetical protein ml_396 [Mollivirus sibericum]